MKCAICGHPIRHLGNGEYTHLNAEGYMDYKMDKLHSPREDDSEDTPSLVDDTISALNLSNDDDDDDDDSSSLSFDSPSFDTPDPDPEFGGGGGFDGAGGGSDW